MYIVSSFFFGETGLFAYRQLYEEHTRLAKNVVELQEVNISLGSNIEELRTNPDTIAVYALEAGYAKEGIAAIKISGINPVQRRGFTAGKYLSMRIPLSLRPILLRTIAIVAILFSLTGFLYSASRRHNGHYAKGTSKGQF